MSSRNPFRSVQHFSRLSLGCLSLTLVLLASGCEGDNKAHLNQPTPTADALPDSSESASLRTEKPASKAVEKEDTREAEIPALAALGNFRARTRTLVNVPGEELRQQMSSLLHELDSLAVEKHFPQAELILDSIAFAQKEVFAAAALASTTSNKGLWISWSEKLLLTHSALKHFFSEHAVSLAEKALDNSRNEEFLSHIELLKRILHRDHERRIVSILRRQDKTSETFQVLLDVLAASGGPLARLNIYQRFLSEPTPALARAMAKTGLPRISDILGENTHVTDGIPFVPNTRTPPHESTLRLSMGDIQKQWKDMQAYFDEIRKIPGRFERARRKWLDAHQQVEILISLLSIDDAAKTALKKEILQTYVTKKSPEQMSYRLDGIEFKEGDIVLLQTGAVGGLWETFTRSGSLFSHLQMVTFGDDGLPYTLEMNFGRILISPLDLHADKYAVVRPRFYAETDRAAVRTAVTQLLQKDISYDFRFDSRDHDSLYCSELASAIFAKAGLKLNPVPFDASSKRAQEILTSAGVRDSGFLAQGSYLSSSDFEVIGQQVNMDPRDLIRGQFVLEAFTRHVADAKAVRLFKHPESHQITALSMLAQTVEPELRRALGPSRFLFTVMTLDKLLHSVEDEVLGVSTLAGRQEGFTASRITELKNALSESLSEAIPKHLSLVFPTKP